MNPLLQIINLYTISKQSLCKEYHSTWKITGDNDYTNHILYPTLPVNFRQLNNILKGNARFFRNIYRFNGLVIQNALLSKNYISIPLIS